MRQKSTLEFRDEFLSIFCAKIQVSLIDRKHHFAIENVTFWLIFKNSDFLGNKKDENCKNKKMSKNKR